MDRKRKAILLFQSLMPSSKKRRMLAEAEWEDTFANLQDDDGDFLDGPG